MDKMLNNLLLKANELDAKQEDYWAKETARAIREGVRRMDALDKWLDSLDFRMRVKEVGDTAP